VLPKRIRTTNGSRGKVDHHRLGGVSANGFHAAILRSLGVTPQRDRQVIQVLWDALDATTRFGTADWQARLTATDQYFKLRGAYAKAQVPTGDRTQRHTVDVAPWLRQIMESRAPQSNGRAIPAAANTDQPEMTRVSSPDRRHATPRG
jgi:hypothetical protein